MKNKASIAIFSLITFLPVLVYLNSLNNGFVYDDYLTVTNNHFIREWRYLASLLSKKYTVISHELTYRPVVTLSYFIDFALWQTKSLGYHLTNVIFHSINVILLYILAYRFSQNQLSAFISCVIFSIHPVLTEAVNAVSYREDLLVVTFVLSAFLFYLKSQKKGGTWNYPVYYPLSLFMFLIALLSKEMAITFPFLIFAYDVICSKNRSSWGRCSIKRFQVYYAGFIAVGCFYVFLRFYVFRNPGESVGYPDNSILVNGIMMVKVVGYYVKLLLLPIPLNADYIMPLTRSLFDRAFMVSVALLFMVAFFIKRSRFTPVFFFPLLWFFITLLPVLNIIPINNPMAERYLYMPGVGFALLCGSLFSFTISKYRNLRTHCIVLVAVLCIGFAWETLLRNKVWLNEYTFSTETIRRSPESFRMYNDLGYFYYRNGRIENAIHAFQDSLKVKNNQARAHCNLGAVYALGGHVEKGIEELTLAVRLKDNYPDAHNNLGLLYKRKGMFEKAINEYRHALTLDPYNAEVLNNLGSAYEKVGKLEDARSVLQDAITIQKNNPLAYYNLGVVYFKLGNIEKAYRNFKKACQFEPTNVDVHISLSIIYKDHFHDTKRAIEHLKEALRLNPNHKYAENIRNTIEVLMTEPQTP